MTRSFAARGIVEGFYGTPWTHDNRRHAISFLAPRGLNAYVYAPKDDTKHRAAWRERYDDDEQAQFRDLCAHAGAHDVQFGFAISPGLDITYDSSSDRALLRDKLVSMLDLGVTWFLLLVDDIPMRAGLAPAQAELAVWLLDAMRTAERAVTLTVCPTEYVGTRPSPYLSDLAGGLPHDVAIMWTGPTVCAPELRADDARSWAAAVEGHDVLVWDNYPVNDALMTRSLHLGAYRGREPELAEVVRGVLCNPMTQARASMVPLATAMEFLRDPDAYDAHESWASAIADVGGHRAPALGVLARACTDSPIASPDALQLAELVDALEDELDGPGWTAAVAEVAAELRAARELPDAFAGDDSLAVEVAPWARAARAAADAGLAALRLIQASRPVATVGEDGRGHAVRPDPEPAMHAAFAVLYVWSGARADENVVYGPRFAIYTPVVQLPDGAPALDAAAALRENANAIDALCRLALRTYDDWRLHASDAPLRVFVDGAERVCAPDGTFDATGSMIMLRQGALCTRLARGQALPFSDRRLS